MIQEGSTDLEMDPGWEGRVEALGQALGNGDFLRNYPEQGVPGMNGMSADGGPDMRRQARQRRRRKSVCRCIRERIALGLTLASRWRYLMRSAHSRARSKDCSTVSISEHRALYLGWDGRSSEISAHNEDREQSRNSSREK